MRQVITISLVLLLTGTVLSAGVASDEDRAKQLQKERAKFEKETDPIDRVKTGIRISDMLLEEISASVRDGAFEQMEMQLSEYTMTIQESHQALIDSGRDAVKRPTGFKELEITLRKHVRKLEDLARTQTLEHRDPLDKTKDFANGVRDKLLKALFP